MKRCSKSCLSVPCWCWTTRSVTSSKTPLPYAHEIDAATQSYILDAFHSMDLRHYDSATGSAAQSLQAERIVVSPAPPNTAVCEPERDEDVGPTMADRSQGIFQGFSVGFDIPPFALESLYSQDEVTEMVNRTARVNVYSIASKPRLKSFKICYLSTSWRNCSKQLTPS
eukprot:TRINITY_DN8672_c0_g1_i2.p3 TRINITY_DN8672_c0_g1~~TRINITY_DN8672_c0_g1_i2.p3  ORF type:complete len:169 (-),score=18.42 TRINITY_DN8672_c0_g1_i2:882-1388(-)